MTDTTHHPIDTVVIVTGAEPLDPDVVERVPAGAIVIGADGGLDHALAAGLIPAGLVGDLDSISPEGLAWAEQHATIQRHPVGKDRTDTELAIEFALGLHPEHLILLAGGGDRLDHTFAAVGALGAPALTGIPLLECWWGRQYARVLHGPTRSTIPTRPDARISLLALHGPCTGVSITGTRWELDRADLPSLIGLGMSNVAAADDVSIGISLGVLTVFVDPPAPVTPPPSGWTVAAAEVSSAEVSSAEVSS